MHVQFPRQSAQVIAPLQALHRLLLELHAVAPPLCHVFPSRLMQSVSIPRVSLLGFSPKPDKEPDKFLEIAPLSSLWRPQRSENAKRTFQPKPCRGVLFPQVWNEAQLDC
jgi:hypothetical protein